MPTRPATHSHPTSTGRQRALLLAAALGLAVTSTAPALPSFFEIGADDFRISEVGGTGDPTTVAASVALAYNAAADEYLVVWAGGPVSSFGHSIYGQRIAAATGLEVGVNDFQISNDGGGHVFGDPAVVFNPTENEYLVVWRDGASGVFGQRLSATGTQVGANDFQVGDGNAPGQPTAVAYNPAANEYLVVWKDLEIVGQRLSAAGGELGADDFTISQTSGVSRSPFHPAVAYGSARDEYLVAWDSDDDSQQADNEFEVFSQRVGGTGALTGGNVRISDMGGLGDPAFDGERPAVAYDLAHDQFMVVWNGRELETPLNQIYGQRLAYVEIGGNPLLIPVGVNDLLVSDTDRSSSSPALAYDGARSEFVVTWNGLEVNTSDMEIFLQRLTHLGAQVLADDVQVSDSGSGSSDFDAFFPALAIRPGQDLMVVWEGDDDTGGLVNDEREIFGQRLDFDILFGDGLESGDLSAWSASQP
jgi:hypothetical protein